MSSAINLHSVDSQAVDYTRDNHLPTAIDPDEGERNKKAFLRLIEEGFNKGNLSVVDELVAPNFREHQFIGGGPTEGPDAVKAVILDCRRLFPDFTLNIEEIVAVGDKVWARGMGGGTNGGSMMGRPPTGKKAAVLAMEVGRFENGKMVEHWGVPDRLHMMVQLGLLPGRPEGPHKSAE